MKAVILCAGFGSRLGDLTKDCPKPLLKVGGYSILERQISLLKKAGVEEIFINLHFQADKIIEEIGDGSKFGVKIKYLNEKTPSGTAGGIKIFEEFLSDVKSFYVLYGDIVFEDNLSDLDKFHKENQAGLSFYVHEREDSNSLVDRESSGLVIKFIERPSEEEKSSYKLQNKTNHFLVNSGIYLLDSDLLNLFTKEDYDLPKDIFPKILEKNKLFALSIKGKRVAVDSKERLELANKVFEESAL